jgi:hypothetical protein
MRNCKSFILTAILIFATTSLSLAAPVNVEIQPSLHWVVTDDTTRTDNFIHYSPLVCTQGALCKIDISEHDTFDNPASRKREEYFDGVVTKITSTVSNDDAFFKGTIEYQTHLGITASYTEKDRSLHGQTIRRYTSYVSGRIKIGQELRIQAGEDINNGVFLVLIFRPTKNAVSQFKNEVIDTDIQRKPAKTKP